MGASNRKSFTQTQSAYSIEEQIKIAQSGMILWESIAEHADKLKHIAHRHYTLKEEKEKTYKLIASHLPHRLTSFCSGCTVYCKGKDNCYLRCRMAAMCKLYQNNADTTELLVIEAIAKTIVAEHQLWIEELIKQKGEK